MTANFILSCKCLPPTINYWLKSEVDFMLCIVKLVSNQLFFVRKVQTSITTVQYDTTHPLTQPHPLQQGDTYSSQCLQLLVH